MRSAIPEAIARELLGLSQRAGIPAVDLDQLAIPTALLTLAPEDVLRRLRALPLADDGRVLTVAIDELNRDSVADELAFRTGREVVLVISPAIMHAAVLEACMQARRRGDTHFRGRRSRGESVLAAALVDARTRAPAPLPLAPAAAPFGLDASSIPIYPGLTPPTEPPARLPPKATLDPFGGKESSFDTAQPRSDVRGRARQRVLVVDDEPGIRLVIKHALTQRGFEVIEAEDGQAALAVLKERAPDALVLDGKLPKVHGFEVLARLRESTRYQLLPVIMVTGVYKGWRNAADLEDRLGVFAVLEKPFDVRELAQLVEDALAGRARATRGDTVAVEAQALYDEASHAYREGRLDAAIEQMSRAVSMDPLSPLLRHQLGLLYAQNGQEFAAISELETAIELAPERFVSLRNLAIIFQRRGMLRRARELWERAMDAAPDEQSRADCRALVLESL